MTIHKINLEQSTESELMAYQIALMTIVSNINNELERVIKKREAIKQKGKNESKNKHNGI